MTLSLRQWSDHVWAFYRDDGNAFGPRLEYVTDSREAHMELETDEQEETAGDRRSA